MSTINPLSEALLKAGIHRIVKRHGNKTHYACGCVVTERRGKPSIFPACDKEECAVRKALQQHAQQRNKTQQRGDAHTMRLPHANSTSGIQIQRQTRRRL